MYIVASKINGRINVVSHECQPWDTETQDIIEIDEALNADAIVDTPAGSISLIDALWTRTGAFSWVDGELMHDEDWDAES